MKKEVEICDRCEKELAVVQCEICTKYLCEDCHRDLDLVCGSDCIRTVSICYPCLGYISDRGINVEIKITR